MFQERQFPAADSFGLPPAGARYVEGARANASRYLTPSPGVSKIRFPSKKMGCVIQGDSRTGEFPDTTKSEEDPDVTEYWDQPPQLKLIYASKNGHRVGPLTRPDRLKHRESAGWVIGEIKHRASIEEEAKESPNRYCKDENGKWICPPGIKAANKIGMDYEVIVPDEKDDIQHRNYNWLEDYFLEDVPDDLEDQLHRVRRLVDRHNGRVLLEDLIKEVPEPAPIYRAIALNAVYFDKRRDLLCRPGQAWVYREEATAIAWSHAHGLPPILSQGFEFYEGNQLLWDGETWTIRKVAKTGCMLQSPRDEIVSIAGKQLITLIDEGAIEPVPTSRPNAKALDILRRARAKDFKEANRKMPLVLRFLDRDHTVTQEVPAKTLRNWRQDYREAEAEYGCGYLGLIPGHARKGNRSDRFDENVEALIDKSLRLDDQSIASMGIYNAYAIYTARCEEEAAEPVCYETYLSRAVSKGIVERIESRNGKRASYKYKGPLPPTAIPAHGDRPWEVAHADHTLSEIALRSRITGEVLGRAWMSLLIDADSTEPLARYYSFQPPSRMSLMMLLRDCVRRHNRLPQRIVVDQGSDFKSIYFEATLAAHMCTKVARPTDEPKFGSRGERANRTIDTKLLGVLLGNSKSMKNIREVYRGMSAEEQAIWTPEQYIKRFDEFLFEVYPNLRGFGLHETPQERFDRLVQQAGSRPARYIPYDERFHLMTMIEPKRRTRMIHPFGVSINHIRYWTSELQDFVGDGKDYEVRYDPMNMARAFICLRGEWLEMYATSPIVREYMESGIDDGLVELMARAVKTSREYRSVPIAYARFLLACKRDEEFLSEQKALTELDEDNDAPPFDDQILDFALPPSTELFELHTPT